MQVETKTFPLWLFLSSVIWDLWYLQQNAYGASIMNIAFVPEKLEREHVIRHMADLLGKNYYNQMDDSEFRFFYFRFHDSNEDEVLDGIEILKSVIHFFEEAYVSYDEDKLEIDESLMVYSEDELIRAIDSLLKTHDKNNDGFINYAEFSSPKY